MCPVPPVITPPILFLTSQTLRDLLLCSLWPVINKLLYSNLRIQNQTPLWSFVELSLTVPHLWVANLLVGQIPVFKTINVANKASFKKPHNIEELEVNLLVFFKHSITISLLFSNLHIFRSNQRIFIVFFHFILN